MTILENVCISAPLDAPAVLCWPRAIKIVDMKHKSIYFVYILKTLSERYYTGYTSNLENRLKLHIKGHGAKYLKGRLPLRLVYVKEYKYLKNAMRAERNIKKYTKKRKEELIKNWANTKLSTGAPMLRYSKMHGV